MMMSMYFARKMKRHTFWLILSVSVFHMHKNFKSISPATLTLLFGTNMTSTLANNLLLIAGIDPVGPSNYDFDEGPDTTFDVDEMFIAEIVSMFDCSSDNDSKHLNDMENIIITMVPNPLQDQPEIISSSPLPQVSPSSSFNDITAADVAKAKNSHTKIPSELTSKGFKSNGLYVVAPADAPAATLTTSSDSIKEESTKTVERGGLPIERSTNPKKRKLPSLSSSAEAETQDAGRTVDAMDEEAKRERNRCHARNSRQRKKSMTCSLKISLDELKAENAKLREQMYIPFGQDKIDSLVTAQLASPSEKLVSALQKPENRVMDSGAVDFFQGLRNKISCASHQKQSLQIVA
jgi:hypothetical protein